MITAFLFICYLRNQEWKCLWGGKETQKSIWRREENINLILPSITENDIAASIIKGKWSQINFYIDIYVLYNKNVALLGRIFIINIY